ncbi:MAG TPA: VOC family protein [Gammaproteobacteria bacterium]
MSGEHHSRVSTLMIDCLDDHFDAALAFWSTALGLSPARRPQAGQRYVTLGRIEGPLHVRLQRVERNPGFHLDIESDDLRAEVGRLEAAGARNQRHVKRWWVLEDPSGTPFCVIRPESDDFPDNANPWRNES